jgi:hypothetical protein
MQTFTCHDCKRVLPVRTEGGTGYGNLQVKPGENLSVAVCYDCCAIRDRELMIKEGRAVLYLTCERRSLKTVRSTKGSVTNWPGSLRFDCHVTSGRHNIAGTRYDCWFKGPDGFEWHGVSYGEYTQLCHCRRTKVRV